MFGEALLESSSALRRRSPWPMATAFTLQFIIASVLILLPLISTGILPITTAPSAPPRYISIEPVHSAPTTPTNTARTDVTLPSPEVVQIANLNPALANPFSRILKGASSDIVDPSVSPQIGIPGGSPLGNMLVPDYHTPPPPPRPFVISHSLEAMLLNKVIPEYPTVARLSGVQGDVKR